MSCELRQLMPKPLSVGDIRAAESSCECRPEGGDGRSASASAVADVRVAFDTSISFQAQDARSEFASHPASCVVDAQARDLELDNVDLGIDYLHVHRSLRWAI